MLLVADYEPTQSFSRTSQNFGVHEGTVKRWVERHAATGDVESSISLRTSLVSTPLLKETALKLIDDSVREMTYGIPSWREHLK